MNEFTAKDTREQEEFAPRAMGPRERYLVGMLGPKQRPRSEPGQADQVSDVETTVQGDATEPELPEALTPQSPGKMWVSSMGLSFAVPLDVDVPSVTAGWGTPQTLNAGAEPVYLRVDWLV